MSRVGVSLQTRVSVVPSVRLPNRNLKGLLSFRLRYEDKSTDNGLEIHVLPFEASSLQITPATASKKYLAR